jgi:hypothetical protein
MENLDNPGRYVWLPLQMPEIPTTKRILHGPILIPIGNVITIPRIILKETGS